LAEPPQSVENFAARPVRAIVVALVAEPTRTRRELNMELRTAQSTLRPLTGVAALFGLTLMLAPLPAAAQGTPEQRAACEGDAMRLCGEFVPDVQRITACMNQTRRYLSAPCRAVFTTGGAKKAKRAGN
jgi:hypothetical protein